MIHKSIVFIIALLSVSFFTTPLVSAADTSGFQAGKIIDDVMFTDTSTMSVSDIQNFLNSKVPTCDTNHAGMTGGTGTVYNPQFICLKDFYENPSGAYTLTFPYTDTNGVAQTGSRTYYYNNAYTYTSLTPVYNNGDYRQGYQLRATIQNMNGTIPSGGISAAQIIYNTAQTYNINPQVLIVLLQKEQGLVTDTWPAPYQYQSATGYGCPDYSPCSAGYAGFSNQLRWAATMFRAIMNNSSTWYTPYILGNNYIQYSPIASCGGTTVNIQNRSTQALYNYTPYQPNAASLAAGYGTGDGCSSYGNRNFYLYFSDWFGNPLLVVVGYMADGYNVNTWLGKPLINAVCSLRDGGCYQLFVNGALYWSPATGTQAIRGGIKDKWVSLGFENGTFGYPTSGELAAADGGVYQTFQGGTINWTAASGAHSFASGIFTLWNSWGGEKGSFGKPITDSICNLKNNGCYQLFDNGAIYWTAETGAQPIRGGIKAKWVSAGFENGTLGFPTSGEVAAGIGGVYQTFQGGTIYWSTNTGAVKFTNDLYASWTANGGTSGALGKPVTDSLCGLKDNGCYQLFDNLTLYWTAQTGAQPIHGGIKAKWMSLGLENGILGFPTSGEISSGTGVYQTFQGGTINWTAASGASVVYN